MKTYVFDRANGSGSLVLSANSFEEAYIELTRITKHPADWICEDENGEDEEN